MKRLVLLLALSVTSARTNQQRAAQEDSAELVHAAASMIAFTRSESSCFSGATAVDFFMQYMDFSDRVAAEDYCQRILDEYVLWSSHCTAFYIASPAVSCGSDVMPDV